MSNDIEDLNLMITREANEILYTLGLFNILKKYGNPHISGSYLLKMMTWRDLDIYLESDRMNDELFFELGKEISINLKPAKMSFRNELIGRTPHLPKGLYWGVYTTFFGQQWKIDIWAISSREFQKKLSEFEKLYSQIDSIKRKRILDLKSQLHSHHKYRKVFFSVDIYEAVVQDNIQTINQFKEWLIEKNGVEL
ncbi:hypothetical protein KHA96_18445 [Bacillus sp. FJAT-49711]|uniref:hypothetical protein n=1 Tax=Bacillus sp. FJAT-49711 TaxID=2833585 RepID=UPI001BC9A15A|nr:hypothetical protein [Bacillus sp. FJAT-49711]MBS4220285.1 hypothetical protein [Bacillus sp. FJAT-49711]